MTNPTTTEIRHYLVVDNGWDDVEVDDLFNDHADAINRDGTTTATRDEWTQWAQEMPESN